MNVFGATISQTGCYSSRRVEISIQAEKANQALRRTVVILLLVNAAGSDRAQSADRMTQTPLGHPVGKEH